MANKAMVQYREVANAMPTNTAVGVQEIVDSLLQVSGIDVNINTIRTRLCNTHNRHGIFKLKKVRGTLYFTMTPEDKDKLIKLGEQVANKRGTSLSKRSRLQTMSKNCQDWSKAGIKAKPGDTVVMLGFA